jgi:hypothetical protein
MSRKKKIRQRAGDHTELTARAEAPELEGLTPMSEELTGRAAGDEEDLRSLFANDAADHYADGFRGGSNDDPQSDIPRDPDTDPGADEDVTAD